MSLPVLPCLLLFSICTASLCTDQHESALNVKTYTDDQHGVQLLLQNTRTQAFVRMDHIDILC